MVRVIAAGTGTVRATAAWVATAGQDAADGSATATDRAVVAAAGRYMVDAEAVTHATFKSTIAGQPA